MSEVHESKKRKRDDDETSNSDPGSEAATPEAKEPARKKAKLEEKTDQDVSDDILHLELTDLGKSSRKKAVKASEKEFKVIRTNDDVKKWKADVKNYNAGVQGDIVKTVGKAKMKRCELAAIQLGKQLAQNEEAKTKAQARGKKSPSKVDGKVVSGAELKQMKLNCIAAQLKLQNGLEYTLSYKPGKLPAANKKWVKAAVTTLIFEKAHPVSRIKEVEALVDTVYSQKFRELQRGPPELCFKGAFPKAKKAGKKGGRKKKGQDPDQDEEGEEKEPEGEDEEPEEEAQDEPEGDEEPEDDEKGSVLDDKVIENVADKVTVTKRSTKASVPPLATAKKSSEAVSCASCASKDSILKETQASSAKEPQVDLVKETQVSSKDPKDDSTKETQVNRPPPLNIDQVESV